jgi:hypothetical protein
MLNCHKATRLISESQDRELSLKENMTLKMHTGICSGCRNFGKQINFIHQAMQKFSKGGKEQKLIDRHDE